MIVQMYSKMDVCRVCLNSQTRNSNKVNSNSFEGVSYNEMFNVVTNSDLGDDEFLCHSCLQDLVVCYNFLLKIKNANKTWKLYEHFNNDLSGLNYDCDRSDIVKDPLEDSEDESVSKEYVCKEDTITPIHYLVENSYDIDHSKEMPKEQLDCSKKLSEINYLDLDTIQECNDEEALFNDLSDLTVSAENLIFPRGRYKCKICEKTYFTNAGWMAHQEVHIPKTHIGKKRRVRGVKKRRVSKSIPDNNTKDFSDDFKTSIEPCENTTGEFNEQTVISKNRKEKQIKPKKMFPCEVCGKHMISASKLRYHMVMHTGEKDYLCSICPKAYSTIYALKHHFRSHTGDRPYECKFCGDRFTRPTTLKSHVRRHTGERPYGCDVCGKRFIQHSSMTTHIKLNHMAKTIPCPHCDKKYARQTDLNTHMLSHTGDKPFPCQLCPSRFIRQANLNKHMNQHHSEKSNDQQKRNRTKRSRIAQKDIPELGNSDTLFVSAGSQLEGNMDHNTFERNPVEPVNSTIFETWSS